MKQGQKAELREERKKGAGKNDNDFDDSDGSDQPNEEDIVIPTKLINISQMRSYEEYQKELLHEMKQKILNSEELDDFVGGADKPRPMDSDQIMVLLKGNKFKFSLDNEHFEEYLIEARRIAEKILKRSVVNIDRGM